MIRFIPQDAALLDALETADRFRERYGADVSRHLDVARGVVRQTLDFEGGAGSAPPWIGYLSVSRETGLVIGCGGFKGNPDADGCVEIAYFTFPAYEGRGFATAMALGLVDIARGASSVRAVTAQTLPESNASTRILHKIGFVRVGEAVDPEVGRVWAWRRELDDRTP